VAIINEVVSSKPVHSEVYSKQHYVIQFVNNLRWFSLDIPVSSTNKTDRHDIAEIFFESDVKHHKPLELLKTSANRLISLPLVHLYHLLLLSLLSSSIYVYVYRFTWPWRLIQKSIWIVHSWFPFEFSLMFIYPNNNLIFEQFWKPQWFFIPSKFWNVDILFLIYQICGVFKGFIWFVWGFFVGFFSVFFLFLFFVCLLVFFFS